VVEDVPIEKITVGEAILVRAGEIIPIDGVVTSGGAMLDEAAITGEPIPVHRRKGEAARSGGVNAGETFEMRAAATAGESTYAGIVRLVTAAQTAKSPFIRLADRYALLLLPVSLGVAGAAWIMSGDAVRGLAVLVAATPCPLILAAPVAFIAGVSQAAKNEILIKGRGPLEALARTRTVMWRGWHRASSARTPRGLVHNPESRNFGLDALAPVARASDAFAGIGIASVGLLVPQQATHVEVISQDPSPPRRMPPDCRIAPMFAARSLDILAIEVPRDRAQQRVHRTLQTDMELVHLAFGTSKEHPLRAPSLECPRNERDGRGKAESHQMECSPDGIG
jgi:E1-E2 ATPase